MLRFRTITAIKTIANMFSDSYLTVSDKTHLIATNRKLAASITRHIPKKNAPIKDMDRGEDLGEGIHIGKET